MEAKLNECQLKTFKEKFIYDMTKVIADTPNEIIPIHFEIAKEMYSNNFKVKLEDSNEKQNS